MASGDIFRAMEFLKGLSITGLAVSLVLLITDFFLGDLIDKPVTLATSLGSAALLLFAALNLKRKERKESESIEP